MDLKSITQKTNLLIKKYKYAILILIIGFVLMLIPGKNNDNDTSLSESMNKTSNEIPVDLQLAQILCRIEGAGDVQVLLTVAEGEKTLYKTDENISNSENSKTSKYDTVTVTDASRNQTGLITQVIPAIYQGAIIVCQGADSPAVKLAIVDAVSKVTGLGADRISVLKMK